MFAAETYSNRRARLSQAMPADSLMIFVGNAESPINYASNTYRFRQDSTFLYLFGLDEPGLCATMDTSTGDTVVYGNDVSMDDIVWTGPMPSLASRAALSGVSTTRPLKELRTNVQKAMASGRRLHYVTPYRAETVLTLSDLTGRSNAETANGASEELMRALVTLRSVKEPCEIAEMERHARFGNAMHLRAMQMAQEGVTENEVMAALEHEALLGGGATSFATISTVNGQTLHNHGYGGTLRLGDLLLVDAGCESMHHYATDNTRTSPVGGTFSQRQREVYQAVLDANNAVAQQSKPGVTYQAMHLAAATAITEGLKGIGLMKGDTAESVVNGAYALFMPHGVGHMLGLDVHDMESYGEHLVGYDHETQRSSLPGLSALRMGRKLQEGFCVTDEPGIYFIPELIERWEAEKKLSEFINYPALKTYKDFGGIRIEDDLVITQDGCRNLGERLPATIDEVEAEVRKGKA